MLNLSRFYSVSNITFTRFATVFNVIDRDGEKIRDPELISYIQKV